MHFQPNRRVNLEIHGTDAQNWIMLNTLDCLIDYELTLLNRSFSPHFLQRVLAFVSAPQSTQAVHHGPACRNKQDDACESGGSDQVEALALYSEVPKTNHRRTQKGNQSPPRGGHHEGRSHGEHATSPQNFPKLAACTQKKH